MRHLLPEILSYCRRQRVAESRFGRDVLRDPAFVNRLRAGAAPRPATCQRVFAWIDRHSQSPKGRAA